MREKIAIIGALSPFGQALLSGLAEFGFPAQQISALEAYTDGDSRIDYGCQTIPLIPLNKCDFQKIGLSFLTTPTLLAEDKERALRYGQYLIDCMGIFNDVPCIIPTLNLSQLENNRLIANPTSLTITLAQVLHPLHQRFKILNVQATALLSAGEFGAQAIQSLVAQTRSLYTREQPPDGPFPKVQAFNLLPEISPTLTRKTLDQMKGLFHFPMTISSCLTPIFQGECYALTFTTKTPCTLKQIEQTLKKEPLCRLCNELTPNFTISTQDTYQCNAIYLTHLRSVPYQPNTFQVWIVCDSIKTGSVLNAIHIASHILQYEI